MPITPTISSQPRLRTQSTAFKIRTTAIPLSRSTKKPKTISSKLANIVPPCSHTEKKMIAEIKLRMASFKESEIKVYDENISKYSSKAVEVPLATYSIFWRARRYSSSSANSKAPMTPNSSVKVYWSSLQEHGKISRPGNSWGQQESPSSIERILRPIEGIRGRDG